MEETALITFVLIDAERNFMESNYFLRPEISNSRLSLFKQSPLHYKYFLDHPQEPTKAMVSGTISHLILFEPDQLEKHFFILDESKKPFPDQDYRNARNKQWRLDQIDYNDGKKMLSVAEYDEKLFMRDAIYKDSQASELLKGASFESEKYWKDSVFGLGCKSKIDIHKKGEYKADYKSTVDANPRAFVKDAWYREYYRQAAFYTDSDGPTEPFFFIAQEKTPPYAISVIKCTNELLDYGRAEYLKLLGEMKHCIEADYWPGYEIKKPMDRDYFEFDLPIHVIQNMI